MGKRVAVEDFTEAREKLGDVPLVQIFNPSHQPISPVGVDGISTVTFAAKSRVTLRQDEISSDIQEAINRKRLEVEPIA